MLHPKPMGRPLGKCPMRFHERLILLFLPLTIIPLAILAFGFLYFIGQGSSDFIWRGNLAEFVVLFFVVMMGIVCLWMIKRAARSLSKPLQASVGYLRRLAQGERTSSFRVEDADIEVQELVEGLDKLRVELSDYELKLKQKSADEAMGKIAAQVAHDLASPLSSMQASLEYFKDLKAVNSKTSDYVNLLELSSKRLKTISRELLDHHKGRSPKQILFSLHKLLDELVGEYQTQTEFKGVEFIKMYHERAIFLYGDRAKIQRAFGNLIKNAVEAMDKFGTLTVCTKIVEGTAVTEIQDTGPGMTPEILKQVLAGGKSIGKEEGHGIGISMVKQAMSEHKGDLKAESEIGIGTIFHVILPLPESRHVKEAEKEEDMTDKFVLLAKEREPIVVIDDDASILEQWRLVLAKHDRNSILCESFEDFEKQKITSALYSTAIIDYHFENSELNGIEIIKRLRERGFENLYLCTAEYWKPSLKKEAKELGVVICPKPLPKIQIREASFVKSETPTRYTSQDTSDASLGYTVLVIDDEKVIRLAWEIVKEKLHIETLHTFANLETLQSAKIDLQTIDIAFVDKNIEDSSYTGSQVIDYLKMRKVGKVVLASGESEEALRQETQFSHVDFITSEKIPTSFKEFFS